MREKIDAVGARELLIVLVFIVPLVVGIVTAVDAAGRPDWAFQRANTSKTLWIVLPLVGVLLCGVVAIVAAVMWFASVKPRVVAASQGA